MKSVNVIWLKVFSVYHRRSEIKCTWQTSKTTFQERQVSKQPLMSRQKGRLELAQTIPASKEILRPILGSKCQSQRNKELQTWPILRIRARSATKLTKDFSNCILCVLLDATAIYKKASISQQLGNMKKNQMFSSLTRNVIV